MDKVTPKKSRSRDIFRKEWTFIKSVVSMSELPKLDLPEIAFVGRSNVGKSSIINALAQQKQLARSSNTPGRTQHLNFFKLGDNLFVVDLPGYGYAKAPLEQKEKWQHLIYLYLTERRNLRRVYLLIDSRHGFMALDIEMMNLLDAEAIPYTIVLTKVDKIGPSKCKAVEEQVLKEISSRPVAFPQIFSTSSQKRNGIDALKENIKVIL